MPARIRVFLALLLGLCALPAMAQPRQNLLEYITADLRKDGGLPAAQQARIAAAIKTRFADYALKTVPAHDTRSADVVLRMVIEGVFDQESEERIADVSFAAWQAMSRGAPPDVVEGIALYGYRKKIPGDLIAAWASGYKDLTDAGVPAEVAADLIRNAVEHDWDLRTFDLFKQNMYFAAKNRFDMRDYATYLFGTYLSGKKLPGATAADSTAYFKQCAANGTKPKLPAYQGVFSRKPFEKIVYEAKPKPEAKAPPAAPKASQPEAKPQVVEPAQPKAEPKPELTPEEFGLAMASLWPGLYATAQSYLGTPYVWGGTTHQGIDCSAFTQNTYGENRVGIPRVSRQQWQTGEPVQLGDLRKGDLLFFNTMGAGVSHVALVVDPNGPTFFHASSSHGVMQASLKQSWFKTRYLGARRIVP